MKRVVSLLERVVSKTSDDTRDGFESRIAEYASLVDGWAGDRSYAPGQTALGQILELLDKSCQQGWQPTRVFVTTDGELGLVWDRDRTYANVSVETDGLMSFYAHDADGNTYGDEIYLAWSDRPLAGTKAV